eukprot:155894_1
MEVLFDIGGNPVGGRVTNYLLEKSRIIKPGLEERNFHIFYMVLGNASQQEREDFYLESPDYYQYLYASQCYTADGINDAENFREMLEGMDVIGISQEERYEMTRIIAAVLWLGNLSFVEDDSETASVVDRQVLDICAHILEVDADLLEKSIVMRRIVTGVGARAEIIEKTLKQADAEFCRDTLAKSLYSNLFDWIVARVNQVIHVDSWDGVSMGILDIYGFEIFEANGFEQLCINFVNERLQQIFIELTIKQEQEEYVAEGIPWEDIDYFNNKPCCDLIELKPGVFSILDDCCNTAKTDIMFCNDLSNFFSGNEFFFSASDSFTIRHYAADVSYFAPGFTEKNKDTLFDDLVEMIQSSRASFAQLMGWHDREILVGQKKRPPTVGRIFKQQVGQLMDSLSACYPHCIRCVKLNCTKKPRDFEDTYIGHQLQYLGLGEHSSAPGGLRRQDALQRVRVALSHTEQGGCLWPSLG